MSRSLCRIVPWALLLAVLPGCWDSHARDVDSGGRRDAGGPVDYFCECCPGVTVLAGSPEACAFACMGRCPAPDECALREVELMCFDHVTVNEETVVDLTYVPDESECFCAQAITCNVAIVEPGRLALSTSLCPAMPTCRACEGPPVAHCAIPPLPTPGTWLIEVNGRTSMELDVLPADVLPERAAVCERHAPPGGCGDYTPMGFDVGSVCHSANTSPGRHVPIRVTEACGGCQSQGPCDVSVVDDVIFVAPTRMNGECGFDCPDVCARNEHVCWTPPLAAGRYRVVVAGFALDDATVIDVGDGGLAVETCIGE